MSSLPGSKKKKKMNASSVLKETGKFFKKKNTNLDNKRKKTADEPEDEVLTKEVRFFVAVGITLFLVMCNFHICGGTGEGIFVLTHGLFGFMAYFLPFILFIGYLFWMSNEGSSSTHKKLRRGTILFLLLCAMAHVCTISASEPFSLFYYFTEGQSGFNGGICGGIIAGSVQHMVGTTATVLMLLIAIIIVGMLFTQRSAVSTIKSSGSAMRDFAKNHNGQLSGIFANLKDSLSQKFNNHNEDYDKEEYESYGDDYDRDGYYDDGYSNDINLSSDENYDNKEYDSSYDNPYENQESYDSSYDSGQIWNWTKQPEKRKAYDYLNESNLKRFEDNEKPLDNAYKMDDNADKSKVNIDYGDNSNLHGYNKFDKDKSRIKNRKESYVRDFDRKTGKHENEQKKPVVYPVDNRKSLSEMGFDDNDFSADTSLKQNIDDFIVYDGLGKNDILEDITDNTDNSLHNKDNLNDEHFIQKDDSEVKSIPKPDIVENTNNEPEKDSLDYNDLTDIKEAEDNNIEYAESVKTNEDKVINKVRSEPSKTIWKEKDSFAGRSNSGAVVFSSPNVKKKEEKKIIKKPYVRPKVDLLSKNKSFSNEIGNTQREIQKKLHSTLQSFGVKVHMGNISVGPTVTRYELEPDPGVKVSRVVALQDDIKLALAAADIRIEAPIPGKSAIGIEVPNRNNTIVGFRELIESEAFKKYPSNLAFAVGRDISGKVTIADLAKMPHLLIAGATGSGKSVCINTLVMSIIYKASPEQVKMIMVDPKVVELSVYNGIPHLLVPVVTDARKAANALRWAVEEMDQRYVKFAAHNVRNLEGYNAYLKREKQKDPSNTEEYLYQMVIIVDELADLMMVAPGEVEEAICRLAQKARAAGIHLVLATQRPSVNVITGLIKANVPSRIAFAVSSGVDSRTIIDMNGAEKLLGKGDMLFYPYGLPKPVRVQGALVSDDEVLRVVEFLQETNGEVSGREMMERVITSASANNTSKSDRDEYFENAARFIIEKDKASIGALQRNFKIGFNRAARLMDQLCEAGIVGEEEGTKPRKILMNMEELTEFLQTE